ncbi:sugar phosphate isomerase/epimerase family protein [Roseimaritima sediminicola]|uniref:sugar phosphate isomerase/epimerase family protein n=1 Tax=Roseimaritima sediminicola TaxID=2662066 RepID=UPI0012983595|nr:sugar phosphate isomerase/epimerase [Roseimaritima sediminicola]
MPRPVTLFTGQWADLPFSEMAQMTKDFGYDGIELACWGDHFEVQRANEEDGYCQQKREALDQLGLQCHAISAHLVGQAVLDNIDQRHKAILPDYVWGDGDPAGVNERAIEELKATARAAQKFNVDVVNGFTGSSIWHLLYSFPPVPESMLEAGFELLAERFNPILDVFGECGVKFALEVHPTEIAFDIHTARRALEALDNRPEFGFNFDPSHLIWQGVDPVQFIREFPDRIYHVHIKDASVTLDGRSGILASHLNFGDPRRGWDFRSPGRGDVNFEEIIRALNVIDYQGPLSIEWEDSGMERTFGAREACEFTKKLDFAPSGRAFDSAFDDGT